MPGTPIITANALIFQAMGEEYLFELRRSGKTWRQICREAYAYAHEHGMEVAAEEPSVDKPWVGNSGLLRFLRAEPGRMEAWKACWKESAELKMEQASQVLDDAPETNAGITKAKAQADQLLWQAARADRQTYGEQPAVALTFNMADLHLAALRQIPEAEIEVLPRDTPAATLPPSKG